MGTFGEWLQQQRALRHLTREEFANRVGCSVAMLRKIEYGERRPSTQIAELIANVLEIPPSNQDTFVGVARGELRTERLSLFSNSAQIIDTSPSRTISRNNFPVLPSPLIGRPHELQELDRLLHNPDCRMLTLVGPGGIGKTRLAMEVAAQLHDDFADGVYFAPLAPVHSARFLVPVIADSIGFSFKSVVPADPKTQLLNYLKGKQVLILADNLEHLLKEPEIELFSELLAFSPQVKLMVTSREPVNLQAEWIFEVHGLPFSEDDTIQGTAIELFWQRGCRAHAGFSITPKDLPAILRICQLVEGNPLAIELAAAWVRTLTCEEIAAEIERNLDFLQISARDLPARHRSMRAVFDHSWKLLSEEEQMILCRLSIFQGGFKREAGEMIAGASLQALASLVIRSLLRHSPSGRYELHDLIRNFALSKLKESSDQLAKTKDIHCSFYLDYYGDRESDLRNERQLIAMAEIKAEFENIRMAWQHAVLQGQIVRLRKAALGFWFYDIYAWFEEADSLFRWTIETWESQNNPDAQRDPETNITLEHIRANHAYLCIKLGKFDEARRFLDQSLPVLRSHGDGVELLNALHHMGVLERLSGNLILSLEIFMELLDSSTRMGARWHKALAHGNVGVAKAALGEFQEAYNQLSTANIGLRSEGDRRILGVGLQFFGEVLRYLGEYEKAQICLNESLEISKIFDDRWLRGLSLNQLGLVFKAIEDYEEAARIFNESLAQFREINEFWGMLQALKNLGAVYLCQGAYPQARSTFCELLTITGHEQILPDALDALLGMAHISMEEGKLEESLALVLLAGDHPLIQLDSKARAELVSNKLLPLLTPQQIEAAHAWKNRSILQDVIFKVVQTGGIQIELESSLP